MKYKVKYSVVILLILGMCNISGCKKLLEPEYRSSLGPEYFSTPAGLEAGVAGCYAICRFFWGSEGFSYTQNAGTDEMDGRQNGSEYFQYNIIPGDGSLTGIWNNSYVAINNLNGVLEFGPVADIEAARKKSLLGEAKFMRAFFYFQLVQTFGDIPLSVKFNTTPSTAAVRNPISEVYDAIIKDLTEAAEDLPVVASGNSKGRASKAAAKHLLGKAYLTRGWSSAAKPTDFDMAYTTFNELITNRAAYGVDLEQDYANVFRNGNEYGRESLFVLDRNTDAVFSESGYNNTTAPDGNKENRSNHYWNPNYTVARNINSDGTASGNLPGSTTNTVQLCNRNTNDGRPFLRYFPTSYTLNTAFGERINDSRYSKTFKTVWICNSPSSASSFYQSTLPALSSTRNGVTTQLVPNVDTAIWMPGREVTIAERQAFKGCIIAPSQYTDVMFPALVKHLDSTRLHFNDPSDRPYILFRLADSYLLGAEAAFKAGKIPEAVSLMNTLRRRAAYRSNYTTTQLANAQAAMDITAGQLTIDFILDERTREFYAEYCRFQDLVRTQSLVNRVTQYIINPAVPTYPSVPKRTINIKPCHVLRPIPQSQIDRVTTGPAFPQNGGGCY
jgi:starch-binding outer membrane protein, SusD/RagB family